MPLTKKIICKKIDSVQKIRQILLSKLNDFDLISFDIFDTLLIRCIHPPDLVKKPASSFLSNLLRNIGIEVSPDEVLSQRGYHEQKLRKQAQALGGDLECRFDLLIKELVIGFLGENSDSAIQHDLIEKTIQHELKLESRVLAPNHLMCDLYREIIQKGKRVILTSDMYLSTRQVEILLSQNGIYTENNACYVSSDIGLCKGSGRLYRYWLKQESVVPEKVIHIGDNAQSDFAAAIQEDMNAILYAEISEISRRSKLQALYTLAEKSEYWKGAYTLKVCELFKEEDLRKNDFFYKYGRNFLGPAYTVYIHKVIEKIREYKIEHILFIAREGFIFQKIYNILSTYFLEPELRPTKCYACLSRYSTGLASANYLTPRELQYGLYKLKQNGILSVLKTYGLPQEPFASIAAEYGIEDIAKPIPIYDYWSNTSLLQFLGDPRVQSAVHKYHIIAKKKLDNYLTECKFWGKNKRVALIDIGWEGTIQDNLIHAFSQREDFPLLYGLYFGKIKGRNFLQYSPSISEGLIYDFRRRDIAEQSITNFLQIFEQGARAPHGSTRGYQSDEFNQYSQPIFRDDKSPDRQDEIRFNPTLAALQQGVMDFASRYVETHALTEYSASEIKPFVLANIARFINLPRQFEASKIINSMKHAEDFGSENSLSLGISNFQKLNLNQWIYLIKNYHEVFWKQGTLRLSGIPGFPFIFSIIKNTTRNLF